MRILVMTLAACLLLTVGTAALEPSEQMAEQFGVSRLERELPEQVRQKLAGTSPEKPSDFLAGASDLLKKAMKDAGGDVRKNLAVSGAIVLVSVLCAMAKDLEPEGGVSPAVLSALLAVTGLCASGLSGMAAQCSQTLEELFQLNTLLLPVMTAAAASAGNVTASAGLCTGITLFSGILMNATLRIFLPLTYAYIAMSLAYAAFSQSSLGRLCQALHGIVSAGLKGILFLYTGCLSITGIAGTAGDAAAVKAAKAAMSGMVPVVGGILSDASETILASAAAIRSYAGVFGLLAVLAVCLTPVCRIGVQYGMLKLTGAVVAAVGTEPVCRQVEALGKASGLFLAMTGSFSLMVMMGCACLMKVNVL